MAEEQGFFGRAAKFVQDKANEGKDALDRRALIRDLTELHGLRHHYDTVDETFDCQLLNREQFPEPEALAGMDIEALRAIGNGQLPQILAVARTQEARLVAVIDHIDWVRMATVYDKDILIFAICQLMAAKNRGEEISRNLSLSARSFLIFANRHMGEGNYEQLEAALDRLTGTRLRTTITTSGHVQDSWFGLVESAYVKRKMTKNGSEGRIEELRDTLSDWLFNAINANEVLSMHPDYFRLRKPMERRIYEIARKHCRLKDEWRVGMETLYKKTGSRSPVKQFRFLLKEITASSHLPDYLVETEESGDDVTFKRRGFN